MEKEGGRRGLWKKYIFFMRKERKRVGITNLRGGLRLK